VTRHTALALAVLAAGASLSGQQPPQPRSDAQLPPITFRAEINYVDVDAVVVDKQGNFVRDLRKDDFQILEDGKPQNVTAFALVDIPVVRAEQPLVTSHPIEPDVQSNADSGGGRLYVIVLDDLHTNPMRSARVRRAAREFVDRNLGANDLAAVVHTSGRDEAAQDFTNSKRRLDEAIDKFMGRGLRSATIELVNQYNLTRDVRAGQPNKDPLEQERAYNARDVLATLRSLSDWLSGIHGRKKAILFISEGIDYDITDVFNKQDATTIIAETRDAVGAASRANVNFYTIDPRGLATVGDDSIEMVGAIPDDPAAGVSRTGFADELRISQDSLRTLADETGGFAAVNSNDFRSAFDRIVQENSSYYVMGYYSTNERRDGRFRRIEVRVKRPGLEVRARKGYVAPQGKVPGAKTVAGDKTPLGLREALDNPIQDAGLGLTVFAAPFKGTLPNASVLLVVRVQGRDLVFKDADGTRNNVLELAYVMIDEKGKVKVASSDTVTLTLKPQTFQAVQQNGIQVQARAEVPPGKYQLRLAVLEKNGGRKGSVHSDIDVPDFSKLPLSMSGLAVTSAQMSRLVPTAGVDPVLKGLMPAPPTTAREFGAGDMLALVTEVYDNTGPTAHRVEITTTLRSDDGRVMFKNSEMRVSSELGGKRGGYGYSAQVPLKDVKPGLYVLRVEARSTLGREATSAREMLIRVVP
jgi:VWFA-related protein